MNDQHITAIETIISPNEEIGFVVTFDRLKEDGTTQRVEITAIENEVVCHNGVENGCGDFHFYIEKFVEQCAVGNIHLFIGYTNTRLLIPQGDFENGLMDFGVKLAGHANLRSEDITHTIYDSHKYGDDEITAMRDAKKYLIEVADKTQRTQNHGAVSVALHVGKRSNGSKWWHQSWFISEIDQPKCAECSRGMTADECGDEDDNERVCDECANETFPPIGTPTTSCKFATPMTINDAHPKTYDRTWGR